MIKTKPDTLLWLSDSRGVYIPRDFANSFVDRDKHVKGVRVQDWTHLENGPDDNECYWDAWQNVCEDATVTDENGVQYRLHQDGDLWLVPVGMEWNDRDETFHWPSDEDSEEYEHEDKLDR
jgi:hypothetical protein